jgi:small subunit ribosomal protein S3
MAKLLHEDLKIREVPDEGTQAGRISKIVIERPHKKCRVTIHSARPGVIIGKKGADIEKLRRKLSKMTDGEVHLNIVEVRKPEIDANLVAAVDRPAAGAPRCVPPRDEARRSVGHASRRRRHPDQLRRPSRRR